MVVRLIHAARQILDNGSCCRRFKNALWRYDQYIANAEGHDNASQFWNDVKSQEQQNIDRLRQLIAEEVRKACF